MIGPKLRDPSTAQFTELTAYRTGEKLTLCGQINAKNAFGAYVGAAPFIISDDGIFVGAEEVTADQVANLCTGTRRASVPEGMLN